MYSSATANPVITALFVEFLQQAKDFVGAQVAPPFFTGEQSARFYKFKKENMLNAPDTIKRAPGSKYSRGRFELSDDSYACDEYGHEEPIDDGMVKKYKNYFSADRAAMRRIAYVMLYNYETRVQALAGALSGYTPAIPWNVFSPTNPNGDGSSNPFTDINYGRELIHDAIGMDPNTLVLPRDVFYALREHPLVRDKIKYTQPAFVTPEILAPAFEVEKILIPGGLKNTANEGQTASVSKIWGKDVYLLVVNDTQDMSAPNAFRTFVWTEENTAALQATGVISPYEGDTDIAIVESYRDESIRSMVHRARQSTDEVTQSSSAAFRISGAVA